MRRFFVSFLLLAVPALALAQPEDAEASPDAEGAGEESNLDAEGASESDDAVADEGGAEEAQPDAEASGADVAAGDEPQLRPPSFEMPDVSGAAEAPREAPETEEGPEESWDAEGDPEEDEDAASLLRRSEPPSADPTRVRWPEPQTVLSLNGYFRMRGELWDNFFLDRELESDVPFRLFRPADRRAIPRGGCRGSSTAMPTADDACRNDRLRFANMRLRLEPTIALTEDVQVFMTVDVFDNLVMGSTPDGLVYAPPGAAAPSAQPDQFTRQERTPGVPLDSFTGTQNPPQALRNSARDSIYVRRAWAQVTNRGLGQLRFGRMASHWGLGMLANQGNGIDDDFSTDVDRLMGITKIAGFYLVAAYDFAAQGLQRELLTDLRGVPFDAAPKDDVRQFVFAVARREDEETARARLQRGSWVFDGGFYFLYRKQFLSSAGVSNAFGGAGDDGSAFVRRDAQAFIPDLWLKFQWGGLRLETEAALIVGEIENIENTSFTEDDFRVLQFGWAFEGEYRLLDEKLAIRLYGGYASGDADVDGLSAQQGLLAQQTDNSRISHFQMHPNYRIDLILWRNIMGRVAGTWYLRPGIGYDLIKSPFGQLFGARVDMVYSHAAQEVQTYGGDSPLGVELDFSLYYRSEDGPEMLDGFYLKAQYGVLFPLAGLGYRTYRGVPERPRPDNQDRNENVGRAQALRLILGAQF